MRSCRCYRETNSSPEPTTQAWIERPFIVRVANDGESAEARITRWLATPNPSLGGECPGDLLRGDANGRCRLEYVIAELEQGAFS